MLGNCGQNDCGFFMIEKNWVVSEEYAFKCIVCPAIWNSDQIEIQGRNGGFVYTVEISI